MDRDLRQDGLAVAGLVAGVVLVVVGVATLLVAPWQYSGGGLVSALQILGAVLTAGIGVGLAALSTARADRPGRR